MGFPCRRASGHRPDRNPQCSNPTPRERAIICGTLEVAGGGPNFRTTGVARGPAGG